MLSRVLSINKGRSALKLYYCSINKGVWALKFTLMLHFEFVAQAVPHQCIAHHGAEHRAAAAAEKTTADASPSRLWIQSYPG